MCGIAAHFVGHGKRVQHVLLALRRMKAAHGGKEIAEAIVSTLSSYGITENLGVFVADNAETNDVAWKAVLAELHPHRDPKESRSRCLGHIINLAAKAFLFGDSVDAFEATVDQVNDLTPQDSNIMRNAQKAWRKQGPLGKLHNIIVFIRASPERQEAFRRNVVGDSNDSKYSLSNFRDLPRDRQPYLSRVWGSQS